MIDKTKESFGMEQFLMKFHNFLIFRITELMQFEYSCNMHEKRKLCKVKNKKLFHLNFSKRIVYCAFV